VKRSLAILCMLAACLSRAAAEDGRQTRWDVHLNVNDLRALAYDGSRIWIATGGGAVAYHPGSEESTVFHRGRDGLLSDSLSQAVAGPDGRIWFGTERVGISILDPGTGSWEPYTSILRPIPGDRIQRIRLGEDSLLVGTAQGFSIQVKSGGDFRLRFPCQEGIDPCGLPSFDVRDLASDPGGDGIWIATALGVVHRDTIGAGGWTTYADGVANPSATRLARHRGEWIAAFPEGVYVLRGPSGERRWTLLAAGMTSDAAIVDLLSVGDALYAAGGKGVWARVGEAAWSLVGGRSFPARALLRTPDGRLWAAGHDPNEAADGLWRFDPAEAQWRRHAFPGPSARSHYLALAFDPEGRLHATTAKSGQVPMRQSYDRREWSRPINLENWCFDLLFGADGLWMAHCCCGASGCDLRLVQGEQTLVQEPRNLRDLVFDADGNLWAASDNDQEAYAQGVWFRDAQTGEWTPITISTAPPGTMMSNRVRAVLPLGEDLWIGYRERGLHRWNLGPDRKPLSGDDGTWALYSTGSVFARRIISDAVTRLAARGNVVWVGTAAGLSVIDLDTDEIRQVGPGFDRLPMPQVSALLPVADGGAWVATGLQGRGGGITRLAPTETGFSFTTYGPPDLPNPNVETLALDPDGWSVWIGTARGLARLTPTPATGRGADEVVAYPNPFIPGCGEGIRLHGFAGLADGLIVNVSGDVVSRFDRRAAGDAVWDGAGASGERLAPGLYWIRLSTPDGLRSVGVGLGDGPCP